MVSCYSLTWINNSRHLFVYVGVSMKLALGWSTLIPKSRCQYSVTEGIEVQDSGNQKLAARSSTDMPLLNIHDLESGLGIGSS